MHFAKDRQKYRQSISYQRLKLARNLAFSLCLSIGYEANPRDLTMHLDHRRRPLNILKYMDNLS